MKKTAAQIADAVLYKLAISAEDAIAKMDKEDRGQAAAEKKLTKQTQKQFDDAVADLNAQTEKSKKNHAKYMDSQSKAIAKGKEESKRLAANRPKLKNAPKGKIPKKLLAGGAAALAAGGAYMAYKGYKKNQEKTAADIADEVFYKLARTPSFADIVDKANGVDNSDAAARAKSYDDMIKKELSKAKAVERAAGQTASKRGPLTKAIHNAWKSKKQWGPKALAAGAAGAAAVGLYQSTKKKDAENK